MILSKGACSPSRGSVADLELDVGHAQAGEPLLRLVRKLLDHLDAVDLARERRRDRRLIPEARADFEHDVIGWMSSMSVISATMKAARSSCRSRSEAACSRRRTPAARRDERMARHAFHRFEHRRESAALPMRALA
jgi:hypothetical protein